MHKSLTIDHINKRISIGDNCPEKNGNVLEVDNVLSVNNAGNIETAGDITIGGHLVPYGYYGLIYCNNTFNFTNDYNYTSATYNGGVTPDCDAYGFEYETRSTYFKNSSATGNTNTRLVKSSAFKVPPGVKLVEVGCYMYLHDVSGKVCRYACAICKTKNLESAPSTTYTITNVVTTETDNYYALYGARIIPVTQDDYLYPRFSKSVASADVNIEICEFTIKAIA